MTDELQAVSLEEARLKVEKLRAEVDALRAQKPAGFFSINPLTAAIFAAALGLIGNLVVAVINGVNQRELEQYRNERELGLEQIKNESALILEAISTGDIDEAKRNIRFFIEAGLIDDTDEAIVKAVETGPVLPAPGGAAQRAYDVCPIISGAFLTEGRDAISLHFGTNVLDASQYGGWDGSLAAAQFDALDMAALAANLGYVTNLRIQSLVRDECLTQDLAALGKSISAGDTLLFSFSGHASQVESPATSANSEATLVLFDRQIPASEFFARFRTFPAGARLIFVLDTNYIGFDPALFADSGLEVIVINGASPGQFAFDGVQNGTFTGTLLKTLAANPAATYADLQRLLAAAMPDNQNPQIAIASGPKELMQFTALAPKSGLLTP